MRTTARSWTVAQHFAIWLGLFTLVSGAIGLAINPDFSVGDHATAEAFAGVDWNGWHGVAAILVGLPGLAMARLPQFAIAYLVSRAATDAGVALWIAFDDRPLGVLFLPTNGDLLFHVLAVAVATAGVVLARRHARTPPVRPN